MKKKVQKSLLFLLTVMMLVSVMSMGLCGISVMAASVQTVDDVVISVPETVYMTPTGGAATAGQYYVNNIIDSDGNYTPAAESADTTGYIAIYAPGMTAFEFNVAIANQDDSSATFSFESTSFTTEYMASAGCGDTKGYIFYDGVNLESVATGLNPGSTALAEWAFKLTYSDGSVKTYYAYSTLYSPHRSVGAVSESRRSGTYNNEISSWISGINGIGNGTYSPISSGRGSKTTVGYFKYDPLWNGLQSGSSESSDDYVTASDTLKYVEAKAPSGAEWTRAVGFLGYLTVDSSRYTNTNQIPNLVIGADALRVNDGKKDSLEKYYAWYVLGDSSKTIGTDESSTPSGWTEFVNKSEPQATSRNTVVPAFAVSDINGKYIHTASQGYCTYLSDKNYANACVSVLCSTVDKAALRELVLQGTSLYSANYTSSTWSAYKTALQNAALALGNPSNSSVDTSALTSARDALQTNLAINANGGTLGDGVPASTAVQVGGGTSVSFNNDDIKGAFFANRTGYTFLGWSTDANATAAPQTVTVGFNDTVYAVWEANKYNVIFDNLIDVSKWNTSSASNGVISNVGNGGFTLTSNDGVGEGTSTSPLFPVTAGKNYKVDIDFEGDGWDVYIFFYDENTQSGTGLEFADNATRRFSSNGSTGVDPDNAVFTAPTGATRAVIRVDANGSNNAVTFKNIKVYEEGTVADGVSFTSSQTVTYDSTYGTLPTPTRTGYDFVGWFDANGNQVKSTDTVKITDTLYLTSQWKLQEYTVTWKNHDGTVLETDTKVSYGATPEYNGATPTKTGDAQYSYTFTGWSPVLSPVTGDVTYTAQFSQSVNKYKVEWQNYNGAVLETDNDVSYGTTPEYNGATPTRPATKQYTYTFAGWTPTVDKVTGNVVYTAKFTETVNNYKVVWQNYDGTVLETDDAVPYGTVPTYNGVTPVKPETDMYTYTFIGWTPAVEGITGNTTYTATFEQKTKTFTVVWQNYDGTVLETDTDVAYGTTPTFDKSTPVKPGDAQYSYTFTGWSPVISAVTGDVTYVAQFDESVNTYVITWTFADGSKQTVELSYGAAITAPANSTKDPDATNHYSYAWDPSVAATVTGTAAYTEKLTATPHDWNSWVETDAPSCTETGSKERTCKDCGYKATETIAELGHSPSEAVEENRTESTCKVSGSYESVVYCSVCGVELSRDTITLPLASHTPGTVVVENNVPAKCTDDGSYDEVVYCTVCSEELSRESKVHTAPGHTEGEAVIENNVAPDCENEGSYDTVVYCSVCGEELSRVSTTVDSLGHTEGEAVIENDVPASCTVNGSYDEVVYCAVCGEEVSRESKVHTAPGHTPKDAVEENRVESTCTVPGSYFSVVYCDVCGTKISSTKVYLDLAPHTPGTAVIENKIEASCVVDGSYDEVVYCTECPAEVSRVKKTITAPGHTPKAAVVENRVESTCTVAGSYENVVYCDVCGAEISRVKVDLPLAEHIPGETVIENNVDASCTVNGSYDEVVYCTECPAELSRETKVNTAPGHSPKEAAKENEVPATCKDDGSYDMVVRCDVCNEILSSEHFVVTATGDHVFATETERQDATCLDDGYVIKACGCGTTETTVLPATGHTGDTPVIENDVPASCTVDGSYDEVVYCKDCGIELSRTGKVHTAPGHTAGTPVRENENAPSCTAKGSYEEVVYCSVCTTELSRIEKEIDVVPHTPAEAVEENRVEPTCKVPGSYEEVVYCSVCGGELSRETKEISVVAHTPAEAVKENDVPAACMVNGSYQMVVYCSVCGDEISRTNHVNVAPGHTPAEAVVENTIDATCTKKGSYDEVVYCSVCGEELSRVTKEIPVVAHTPDTAVEENRVEPTCKVPGSYEEVVYCSVCGGELSRTTKEISVVAHTPDAAVEENRVEPTCKVPGSYDSVVYCSVCGDELSRTTESIAVVAHTPDSAVEENRTESTCKVPGSYDTVVYCSVCGDELSRETTTLPLADHTEGEAVVENDVPASCTVDGSYDEVVYCTVCDEELSRETKVHTAPGHTDGEAVVENDVPASCTVDGSYDEVVYCTVCGEELSRETKVHTAPGHTAGEAVRENEVIGNCITGSSFDEVVYCTVCGEEMSREHKTVASGSHKPGAIVIENKVEGTCLVASSFDEVRYCTECGEETSRITIYGSTASHKYGKAVKENEIPATCTTPGTYDQVVYCTVCGTECSRTTVSVGAKGHTIVADAAVAPTCDKTGKTLGSHCSVCDEVIVAQQTVPASGHTEVIDRAVEPTCTRPGKTEGSHCGECGKVLVAADEIPADGHLDEDGDGICDIDGRDVNDMDPDYDSGLGFGPDYEGSGDYEEDLCDRCGREHINFFSEIICLIIRFFRLLGMKV